jgi:anti-anti-sigma factor
LDELSDADVPEVDVEVREPGSGAALITLRGELDLSNIPQVERAAATVLAKAPTELSVDIGELEFADSSAIAMWLRWAASVERFELRNPAPLLRRVLESMGLSQKLRVTP